MKHDRAYFISGMQRSGNHAVIHWIIQQSNKPVTFLNNREPWREDKDLILKKDKIKKNGNLIVSYEDVDYENIEMKKLQSFMKKREKEFGSYNHRYDVIILRDPFNLFASRLFAILNNPKIRKKGADYFKRKMNQKLEDSVRVWKNYAKLFISLSIEERQDIVLVNYNEWFKSKDYRQIKSEFLGLQFTDKGINDVPESGTRRSSFDDSAFDGKAQDMKVLDRWKQARDNDRYRKLFKDDEMTKLSEKIFGPIEGTEIFQS